MTSPLLYFDVHHHALALPLRDILGVHEMVPVAPLAGVSPAVLGLATVQGRVVTVLDPGVLLTRDGDPAAAEHGAVLVLLDGDARGVALLLSLPLRVAAAGKMTDGHAIEALAKLCARTCPGPDGRITGIVESAALLRLSADGEGSWSIPSAT